MVWVTSREAMQDWAEYGGATARSDIDTDRPELVAAIESADVVRGGMRYTFAPELLDSTNRHLNDFIAGTTSADDALASISEELSEIVVREGYLE